MSTLVFAQYSFAVSIEQIINVFITPITVSMYNYFCKITDISKIAEVKRYVMLWGSLIIAGAFPLKVIIRALLPEYSDSSDLIFLLFAAHAFYTVIKGIYVNYYKAKGLQSLYFKQLVGMTLVAFGANCIGYYIFKSMYAIAGATLLTAVIWYVFCEFITKELRGGLRDNLSFFLMIIAYLILGIKFNAILGCVCYIATMCIVLVILMRGTLNNIVTELISIKRKLLG
jgi:O-antigen/teichoic acid export membrane protein